MTRKELIILRGLSGSGKSEKAKKLVGNGAIHSTDSYFVQKGKYVFDGSKLGRFHCLNLLASIRSMKKGVSPVIIDNTNVVSRHCEKYVEAGKKYGYKITVIEPDTPWAFNVEELIKRNKHGVSADSIVEMLQQYEDHNTFKEKLGL